jgi:hypothetical protein
MNPIRLFVYEPVALLEKENVRSDLRAGCGLEGVVWQPDSAEQSARCAMYLRTTGLSLSIVPLEVMKATIPPGLTLSRVLAKK